MIQYLSRLEDNFGKFWHDFSLLGKHLSHAQTSYQRTEKRPEQPGQRLPPDANDVSRSLLNSVRTIEKRANQTVRDIL